MLRDAMVKWLSLLHKAWIRFCAGSDPAHGVSEIRDGEHLWQWYWLKTKLSAFRRSTIPKKQFIIIDHYLMMKKLVRIARYLQDLSTIFWCCQSKTIKICNIKCFGRFLCKYEELVFSLRLIWTFSFIIW